MIIPTLLAQGIYTGIMETISYVTVGTCSTVKTIYTHRNPNVTNILKELDIERRLKLVQSVINTMNFQSVNKIDKSQISQLIKNTDDINCDPIRLCLLYLCEIIQEIHNNLLEINKKVLYHQTKWFNSWRTLNVTNLLTNLRINSNLLNERFNDLTKIKIFLKNK